MAPHFLGGLKQRLLSFLYKGFLASGNDGRADDDVSRDSDRDVTGISPTGVAEGLAEGRRARFNFHFHFQHFSDLVMLRLQFLDRQHVLIKYGSPEGLAARNSQEVVQQNAFLMLYNIQSAEVLAFYQNTSTVFCSLLERFHDAFLALSGEAGSCRFLSSFSNCAYMREQLQKSCRPATGGSQAGGGASGGSLHPQIVRRILAGVPCPSQAHSPSPYFDMSLFQFDDKLISSTDQPKPFVDHAIKFFSRRRRPNNLRFKIKPGVEATGAESSTNTNKRLALYIFHPRLPFVISVQQVFMQASVINFHLRL